jgi:hypothetical protein
MLRPYTIFILYRNERPPHLREAFEVMIKLYAQHAKSNVRPGRMRDAQSSLYSLIDYRKRRDW